MHKLTVTDINGDVVVIEGEEMDEGILLITENGFELIPALCQT